MASARAVLPADKRRATSRPAAQRREEILRAAIHAFARKGFREAGTAEIARSVGVSEPTIYRYFTSKRELYLEALDQSSREILDRWRDLASRSASPVEALLALGRWYFDELRSNPDRMMLQARAETETEDPEVAARLGSHLLEVFDLVRSTYRAAQDQGLIDATVDLEARTWLFMSIGAILDRTELLGLRARLGEMEIARIIASTAPELLRHLEGRSASNA